jgi:hypothetical protein
MLQILFACPRTRQFVPTGIETDLDTFIALPEVLSLSQCPACGRSHYWSKSETWISDSLRTRSATLPADSVLPRYNSRIAAAKPGAAIAGRAVSG